MSAARAFQSFVGVFFSTPIGRKVAMAVTGVGAGVFLVLHLAGNLVVFEGKPAFDQYATTLHAFPFLIVLEIGLGLVLVAHASLGVAVFIENRRARPIGYAVRPDAGAKTLASTTMIYTGLLMLAFIAFHLWTVKYGPGDDVPAYERVAQALRDPPTAIAYLVGLTAVGLHVSHGATSALLTLGLRHPLHDPWVDLVGRAAATLMAIGFASIVFWFLLGGVAA